MTNPHPRHGVTRPGNVTLNFHDGSGDHFVEPEYRMCLECYALPECMQDSVNCPAGFGVHEAARREREALRGQLQRTLKRRG